MPDCLIVTGGKNTRFGGKPKSLVQICGKTLLDINIGLMQKFCRKVFVCYFYEYESEFKIVANRHPGVVWIRLNKRLGEGDAILSCLESRKDMGEDLIIKWGDSFQDEMVLNKLINEAIAEFNVICQMENKPYVRFNTRPDGSISSIEFSKYEKINGSGWHDLSVFLIKKAPVLGFMKKYRTKYFNNVIYTTFNNEFNLLRMINEFKDIKTKVICCDGRQISSFNTPGELKKMRKMLNEK